MSFVAINLKKTEAMLRSNLIQQVNKYKVFLDFNVSDDQYRGLVNISF